MVTSSLYLKCPVWPKVCRKDRISCLEAHSGIEKTGRSFSESAATIGAFRAAANPPGTFQPCGFKRGGVTSRETTEDGVQKGYFEQPAPFRNGIYFQYDGENVGTEQAGRET